MKPAAPASGANSVSHITREALEHPLTLGGKLAYGCGDLSSNLVWGLMVSFLMYYYTDIYVIPAAVVAWLLLVPRVVDAFCDPLFGYLVDRSGGRHVIRLMGFLAVPFGLMAFFCFLPLPLTGTAKIVWACGTYLILGIVYSAINTPYGALSNMMAINTRERVALNVFRMGGCQLGQFIIASATLPAIAWAGGSSSLHAQQLGMTYVAGAIGVAAAILWLVTSGGCRVRRPLPYEQHSLRQLTSVLVTNRRLHLSNALTYLNFTVFCAQGGLAIHYTRFILHRPASDAALLLTCTTIAAFTGVALVSLLTRRFGVRHTYLGLLVWQAANLLLMLFFSESFPIILVATALNFLASGPLSPLCLAMLSEAVDEGRDKTGVAAAGLAFAFNTLVGKLAAGMAGFAIATFLAWGHYSPTLVSADANLEWWLKAGFIGLPLCAVGLAFFLMLLSRRDEQTLSPAAASSQALGT
jgi:GPH family glycoside/pentoside/hexuronide:cation symporter